MLVEDSGGDDPNAAELHLPSVQEAEDVNKLGIHWKMVTVQADRASYPVITILAERAFDLNVDIPETARKINDDVLSVNIRKRPVGCELPASAHYA